MSLLLKVLIGVVGTVVIASVVTGVVATSSAENPAPRETIVINDEGRNPVDKRGEEAEEQDEGEDDEDGIKSVRVDPDTLEDRRDDRRDAREDRRDDRQDRLDDLTDDDSSGHGSGGDDDSSGHGSGGSSGSGSGGDDSSGHGSGDDD